VELGTLRVGRGCLDRGGAGLGRRLHLGWLKALIAAMLVRTALLLHCSRATLAAPRNPFKRIGTLSASIDSEENPYSSLRGLPHSLGRDAGAWALSGAVPERSADGQYSVATFAGGCFWGTELRYQRLPGVIATCVGYTEGRTTRPTYEQVCTGRTGHTEACQLIYDPKQVSFTELCEALFRSIDPTKRDQVGNDFGTQYRHGIFCHTEHQLKEAKSFVASQAKGLPPGKSIVTEVKRATVFWPAEAYHQQYLQRGGRFGSAQSAAKGCNDAVRCYG
jgi:peptide-methionine (S)-S-oxide reductase